MGAISYRSVIREARKYKLTERKKKSEDDDLRRGGGDSSEEEAAKEAAAKGYEKMPDGPIYSPDVAVLENHDSLAAGFEFPKPHFEIVLHGTWLQTGWLKK